MKQLSIKILNTFSAFLVLSYCIGPVYAFIPCEKKCCCCSNMSDMLSECNSDYCDASCRTDKQDNPAQPLSSVNNTVLNLQVRLLYTPEKLYIIQSMAQLISEGKPALFAGQNDFNLSTTITRLLFPLRI